MIKREFLKPVQAVTVPETMQAVNAKIDYETLSAIISVDYGPASVIFEYRNGNLEKPINTIISSDLTDAEFETAYSLASAILASYTENELLYIVNCEREFLFVQAKLQEIGYKLNDYDEYKQTETWQGKNMYITIKLEEEDKPEPCKQFLAGYDSDYGCEKIECASIQEAKDIILQAYNSLFLAGLATEFSASIYKRINDLPFNEDYFDDTWTEIGWTNLATYESESLVFKFGEE